MLTLNLGTAAGLSVLTWIVMYLVWSVTGSALWAIVAWLSLIALVVITCLQVMNRKNRT
jgi:hypothetical protein